LFFKPFKLRKLFFTSSGSRYNYKFYNKLNCQIILKQLTIKKKWNAGRNTLGRIVIRTKSSLLIHNKIININFNFRYFKLGFISSFIFVPFKNKLISLVYFSNGIFTYYLTNESSKLFLFLFSTFSKKISKIKLNNIFFMLFKIKKLSFVSCLELTPGKLAQYARSSGVKAKIIKFDYYNHCVLVQLPSTIKKIFSYYSFVMLNKISLSEHSNMSNGKAGYWRSFGSKSLVRGVAMNPVDHPNGGRTKSIKYPRTPWGKTTKYK